MTRGGEKLYGENNPFYGKTHSDETKKMLYKKASERVGEQNPFYGKHHSEETKSAISKSNKGRKMSEEARTHMSESHVGKTLSEETKLKVAKSKYKPINMLDDDGNIIFTFDSIQQAGEWCLEQGLTKAKRLGGISSGIKNHKKRYGYYWEYV